MNKGITLLIFIITIVGFGIISVKNKRWANKMYSAEEKRTNDLQKMDIINSKEKEHKIRSTNDVKYKQLYINNDEETMLRHLVLKALSRKSRDKQLEIEGSTKQERYAKEEPKSKKTRVRDNEQKREMLRERWENEKEDQKWSEEVTNYINDMIDHSEYEGINVDSVQCRSTLCRMEIGFKNLSEASRFWEMASLPDYEIRIFNKGNDSILEYIIYIARESVKTQDMY